MSDPVIPARTRSVLGMMSFQNIKGDAYHLQAKAQSEADALRKENDALRIEVSKLNRTVADVSDQLKTSQARVVDMKNQLFIVPLTIKEIVV